MSLHHTVRAAHEKFANGRVRRADGGKIAEEQEAAKAADAVHSHESHLHPGAPKTKLPRKRGGKVGGEAPKDRLDKRARGGAMKHHKGKHPAVKVVIHTGGAQAGQQLGQQMGMQQGMKMGAAMAAQKLANANGPQPPMAPPPGMAPPGAPPPRPPMGMNGPPPPMMRARGGAMDMTAGAGSGEGRREKEGLPGLVPVKAHTRRARGGKMCD